MTRLVRRFGGENRMYRQPNTEANWHYPSKGHAVEWLLLRLKFVSSCPSENFVYMCEHTRLSKFDVFKLPNYTKILGLVLIHQADFSNFVFSGNLSVNKNVIF